MKQLGDNDYLVDEYSVNLSDKKGWLCTCPDWVFRKECGKRGECKHIRVVKIKRGEIRLD